MSIHLFRGLILAVSVFCVYIIFVRVAQWNPMSKFNVVLQDRNEDICKSSIASDWKSCLREVLLNQEVMGSLIEVTEKCAKLYFNFTNLVTVRSKDEPKTIILPVNKNEVECTVVTLGVGNDTGSERGLQALLPQCKFYGADPILESGQVYSEIGQYYHVAVGGGDGNYSASVLKSGDYQKQIVEHISFAKFITLTQIKFLDYFFLDAEGAEYGILPLVEHGASYSGLTICQLNMEIHLQPTDYSITIEQFNKIIMDFIDKSPFLPIIMEQPGHFRSVWINFYSKVCIKKYLPHIQCI